MGCRRAKFGKQQLAWCMALLGAWLIPMAGMAQDEKEPVQQFRNVVEFKMPAVETREGVMVVPQPTEIVGNDSINPDSAGVYYVAEDGLWELMDRHVAMNKERSEAEGFRVQIYAGSSLESANDAKAD